MSDKKYELVTPREMKILQMKADNWYATSPTKSKFFSSVALVKNGIMEYIANQHGKTIYNDTIQL